MGRACAPAVLVCLALLLSPPAAWAQANGDFRSRQSGDWNDTNSWERFNGTTWISPATNTPTSANLATTIQNGHTLTIIANVTNDQVVIQTGGQVNLNAGVTWTLANGTGTDLNVAGTLQNAGTLTLSSATITFQSGGKYQHNQNDGTVPTATWNSGSLCEITGVTATAPAGLSQTFADFTWNCASQSADLTLSTRPTTINGNFTLSNTGGFQLIGAGGTTSWTLGINGDLILTGGTFNFSSGTGGTLILNLAGSYQQSGGNFDCANSGSTLSFNFTGAGAAFTQTAGTLASTRVNFTVNSSASLTLNHELGLASGRTLTVNGLLQCGMSAVTGPGNFTLASGATLGLGHTDGLSAGSATGNLRVSGTRTLNAAANYVFNGTSPQVTGDGLPATVNNFTNNNSAGLTLSASLTVNGGLRLLGSHLQTGANQINLANTANTSLTADADHHIIGTLRKTFATGNGQTFTFHVGDGTDYAPVTLSAMNITSGNTGTLAVRTDPGDHPDLTGASLEPTRSVNRTWTLIKGGNFTPSTSTATFNWPASDLDGAANADWLVTRRRVEGAWFATTNANRTPTSLQATSLSAFGEFAVAENTFAGYTVSAAATQTVNVPFPVTVRTRDNFGQTILRDSATELTLTGSGSVQFDANLDGTYGDNQKTVTNGVLVVNARDVVTETITLTATDANSVSDTSSNIVIASAAATKLLVTLPGQTFVPGLGNTGSPLPQTAGAPFALTRLTALDAFDNVATSYSGSKTITYSGPGGTAAYTTTVNFTAGQSTTTLNTTLRRAETTNLTASASGLTGVPSSTFTVQPGPYARLQLLVPGETAVPGTTAGKTGTPTARTAGAAFNITVTATDTNWNPVIAADLVGLLSTDTNAALPAATALVGGAQTLAVTLKTAGTRTLTATNLTDGTKTSHTSPNLTVNAGTFVKLQILSPGEGAAPGSVTGKVGTPTAQTAGITFNVIVNGVDAWWNLVTSASGSAYTMRIATSDPNATTPADANLSSGTRTFSVTLKTGGAATVTVTDVDDPSKTPDTTALIPVNAGALNKLQVLVPGETASPGTTTGKTGLPHVQYAGSPFSVLVRGVDANWNLANTNDTIRLSSNDGAAVLPPDSALAAGLANLTVTLNSLGTNLTVTSSNVTRPTIPANTSAAITVLATPGPGLRPVVAIHDSELTRALATLPATAPTPTNAGTTGFEWWPTNWPYFVMPESLKEALRSDGTAFEIVSDSDIAAGRLLDTNGQPRYPILISLAAEAIADEAIAPLTNYVAAGGFLFAGSSAFTRHPNGASRGNFALADEMGLSMVNPNLTNWLQNSTVTRQSNHRLVSHLPEGALTWGMPLAADEIPWGISPSHVYGLPHLIWQVAPSNATVIAQGNSRPWLLVKSYGGGQFIYHAAMQPLIGHSGWAPGMYAYGIFREAIQWAFEAAKAPIPKVSSWPYQYNAAFTIRHDLENYQELIANIAASAQFEQSYGVKGDYYFCTGTLREDMSNSNAAIAGLRSAVTNFGGTIGSHNGGLRNPNNPALNKLDFDYWHWGPDEALDVTPTNYASGKAYALISISNSFHNIETWLAGVTNSIRTFVGCYFNSTREDSYDILSQLNVRVAGEQKIGPFPHWTVSTRTPGKRYATVTLPVSDWYVGSGALQVAQSMEAGHNLGTLQEAIDYYYRLGALINIYSHTLSTGFGQAGSLTTEYVTYGMNTNLHPRLWAANATEIYQWWLQRSNVQIATTFTNAGGQRVLNLTVAGATHTNTSVEALLPGPGGFTGLQVLTNGVMAGEGGYRIQGQVVKVRVGNNVTSVSLRYYPAPKVEPDSYNLTQNTPLTVDAPGVLVNDTAGSDGGNLTAELVSSPANGILNLSSNGGFNYSPSTNFTGWDSFSYRVGDGFTNSADAWVVLSVRPADGLFYDDFARAAGMSGLAPWEVALGNWSLMNGALAGSSADGHYGCAFVRSNWSDYAVAGRVRFAAGAYGGGLGGRLNRVTGARYSAWVYPEGSLGGSSVVKLLKFTAWGAWVTPPMAQAALPGVGTNWHDLKLTFQGNRIQVHYDGAPVVDVVDENWQGTGVYTNGGISADMWTYGSPLAMGVEDVVVSSLSGVPVAQGDAFSTAAGFALRVAAPGVLANDGGGSGPLSAVLVAGPTNGVLVLTNNGGFSYTPGNGYLGPDGFTYRASDGVTNSGVALVSLTVTSTNTAPVAAGEAYRYRANQVLSVGSPGVLANDSDPDGNPLAAVLASGPAHGVLVLESNGGFSYTPGTNFNGADSFTYRASDGLTNSGVATVTLRDPTAGSFFADDFARAGNSGELAPWVVQSGNWTLPQETLQGASAGKEYGYAYLTNDWTNHTVEGRIRFPAGAFGGGLGVRLNPATGSHYAAWIYPEPPPGGSAVLRLIKFQSLTAWGYTNAGFTPMAQVAIPALGTNWHTLRVACHGNQLGVYYDGVQRLSVMDLEAQPLPSGGVSADLWTDLTPYAMSLDDVIVSPLAADDSYNVAANSILSVVAPGVLGNDTGVWDTNLAALVVSGPTHGTLNLSSNGGFAYTPDSNYWGGDSFTYQSSDGFTNLGIATVALTITPPSLTNTPPVLPGQTNRTVAEWEPLVVTNTATDSDLPAQALSYSLAVTNLADNSAVTNAAIDTNGVIIWTPTEAQGPGTNEFTTVVTDGGGLSATNRFEVVVEEVNSAPVPAGQSEATVAELTLLVLTNTASDADLPAQALSYSLAVTNLSDNSAVTNAAIDTNGVIIWTPTEAQGPGTNLFVVVVSDDGSPPLRATNVFVVVVEEVNTVPVLPEQTDSEIAELTLLTVTNTASDADLPANVLSYTLAVTNLADNSAVTNAAIAVDGVITWTPTEAQGPSTNRFTTVVTDEGGLSATNTFAVVVTEASPPVEETPVIQAIRVTNDVVIVTWSAITGRTYRLQYKNTLSATNWDDVSPDWPASDVTVTGTNAVTGQTGRFYRVLLVPLP